MNRALGVSAVLLALSPVAATAQDATMSFFVTSANPGAGGDLGGLAGADAQCAALAEAAGEAGRSWAAYLSTSEVDARDRIGDGPWFNVAGVKIADDVAGLHGEGNAIAKDTALDETGRRSTAAATSRTATTSSPARSLMAPRSPATPTPPAATGQKAARARRWSATTTAPASTRARRRSRGTRRTSRAAAATTR